MAGSGTGEGANVEVKVADASANPYLTVGALVAAGLEGIRRELTLPPEAVCDPATMTVEARSAAGITRLPGSLTEALDAFDANPVLRPAMGGDLADVWSSVRRAEADRFAAASDEEVILASRWVW